MFALSIQLNKIVKMNVTKVGEGKFRVEGKDRIVIISTKVFSGWQKKIWNLTAGQMSNESVQIIGRAIEESGNF